MLVDALEDYAVSPTVLGCVPRLIGQLHGDALDEFERRLDVEEIATDRERDDDDECRDRGGAIQ